MVSEAHLPWPVRLRLIRRRWEHRGRNLLLGLLRWILTDENRSGRPRGGSERVQVKKVGIEAEDLPIPLLAKEGLGEVPIFSSFTRSELERERANIQKILIIRTGKPLGDALMSLVLVPECRRLFPNSRVDFLLRDNISPLFMDGAGADRVLEWHPRIWKWPWRTLCLLRSLRQTRYHLAIACDNPFKSSFTTLCFTLITGARHRIGFENDESRAFLSLPVAPLRDERMTSNLLRLLAPFGGIAGRGVPVFRPPPHAIEEVQRILGPDQNPILIFASSHWRKSWPLEAFARLAAEFTVRRHQVLLAFGPGDHRGDDPIVRQWIASSNGLGRVLTAQKLTVLAAILRQCRLFVANDCGPYHLAAAVGARCVAAFRIRDGQREFGYEEPNRFVTIYHPVLEEAERMTLDASLKLLGMT